MTRLKICGIRHAGDLEACRGADYLGFVVLSRSPNEIPLERAAELMSVCERRRVAVTTETRADLLRAMVRRLDPDVLQLHTPSYREAIARAGDLGVPVWGMMPMVDHSAPGDLGCIEALVLDTLGPRAGGNGMVHDWSLSREVRDAVHPFPVILAGGIGPENAGMAARTVMPFALDVSSKVKGPEGKDPSKVKDLIRNLRGALD